MEYCENRSIHYISGFLNFLNELFLRNKKVCVFTNSSKKRMNKILECLPELSKIGDWVTKTDCINKKPNCE